MPNIKKKWNPESFKIVCYAKEVKNVPIVVMISDFMTLVGCPFTIPFRSGDHLKDLSIWPKGIHNKGLEMARYENEHAKKTLNNTF